MQAKFARRLCGLADAEIFLGAAVVLSYMFLHRHTPLANRLFFWMHASKRLVTSCAEQEMHAPPGARIQG
jgi:hypothetical protein